MLRGGRGIFKTFFVQTDEGFTQPLSTGRGSRVKRSRVQSGPAQPADWRVMMPPNFPSRPRWPAVEKLFPADLLRSTWASIFSTWVAIRTWSVPGTHRVGIPVVADHQVFHRDKHGVTEVELAGASAAGWIRGFFSG